MSIIIRTGQMENLLDASTLLSRSIYYMESVRHPEIDALIPEMKVLRDRLRNILAVTSTIDDINTEANQSDNE